MVLHETCGSKSESDIDGTFSIQTLSEFLLTLLGILEFVLYIVETMNDKQDTYILYTLETKTFYFFQFLEGIFRYSELLFLIYDGMNHSVFNNFYDILEQFNE